MSFEIRSSFIGDFKLGDNINFNLDLLAILYSGLENADDYQKALLRKPIIITLVSITEAVLHDFHRRIQIFTSERVRNVGDAIANYIRGKQLDVLERLIASAHRCPSRR